MSNYNLLVNFYTHNYIRGKLLKCLLPTVDFQKILETLGNNLQGKLLQIHNENDSSSFL